MKRRFALLASIGALSLVGLGLGGHASAAPSDQDTTWMIAAHQSNLAEIAGGQAAVAQGTSADVKRLGQMFIDMHTELDANLVAAAGPLGVVLPPAPTPTQQQNLAAVKAKTGAAFDTVWIADQIAGHQTALAATTTEINSGSDATVVGLATATSPVVQQHLDELQQVATAAGAPVLVQTGDGGLLATPESGRDLTPWVLTAGGLLLVGFGIASKVLLRRR